MGALSGRIASTGLLIAALSAAVCGAAAGQDVRGTVVDGATAAPIAGATVTLRDAADQLQRVTLTDQWGRFRVAAPGPGEYRLEARHIAFASVQSEVVLRDGETLVVQLRMTTAAVPLDTLRVEVDPPAGFQGFGARRARGIGFFLDEAEVRATRTWRGPAELLRNAPGMNLDYDRAGRAVLRPYLGWGCLVVYIDWWPWGIWTPRGARAGQPLHEVLYHRDVVAVEAYAQSSDVPPELEHMAYDSGARRPCGLVIFWTHQNPATRSPAPGM